MHNLYAIAEGCTIVYMAIHFRLITMEMKFVILFLVC